MTLLNNKTVKKITGTSLQQDHCYTLSNDGADQFCWIQWIWRWFTNPSFKMEQQAGAMKWTVKSCYDFWSPTLTTLDISRFKSVPALSLPGRHPGQCLCYWSLLLCQEFWLSTGSVVEQGQSPSGYSLHHATWLNCTLYMQSQQLLNKRKAF